MIFSTTFFHYKQPKFFMQILSINKHNLFDLIYRSCYNECYSINIYVSRIIPNSVANVRHNRSRYMYNHREYVIVIVFFSDSSGRAEFYSRGKGYAVLGQNCVMAIDVKSCIFCSFIICAI